MLKSDNHQGDCQLSDRHNYKMMQDIIFDLIPRNLDQEDVALIPGNREREDFATMPERNMKERNTSDSKQNNPSEISSMDTSEKDHPDTCSSLMVSGLGKAVERMLWDKCVECVKQVPELCDGFMRRFCDKLLTGMWLFLLKHQMHVWVCLGYCYLMSDCDQLCTILLKV